MIKGRSFRSSVSDVANVRAALAIAGLAFFGVACGGEETSSATARYPWCLPGPPSLEVGSGSSSFDPIEPGGSIPIISGPQGGTHVNISARTRGLGPSALVEYGANDAETGELLTWMGLKQVVPLKEGDLGGEVHGLVAFLSDPSPTANTGRRAVLWLIVDDDCNPTMRGEAHAILVHPAP
jgi:hypothetical protein